MNEELNISLEPHLREALTPLPPLLPAPIAERLKSHLNVENPSQSIPTITYSLLHSISQWSRTSPGLEALQNNIPPLPPHSYSMVALLAGTTTSPERHFPSYVPPDPRADRQREMNDRKIVTSILNALLSIGGSGIATWLAAERWKSEWVCFFFSCLISSLYFVFFAPAESFS